MSRTARGIVGGLCYHVLNRGNAGMEIFRKPEDYAVFVGLMGDCCERFPMRVLDYSVMPNHFHFVLWPEGDKDVARWMHWLMTTHVTRYHKHYGTHGHIWGGRFKSFAIQEDGHLYTVFRYVDRNAVRAHLVRTAESWPWCAVGARHAGKAPGFLHPWPLPVPDQWLYLVNDPESQASLDDTRRCVNRGIPLGSDAWVRSTAERLGLKSLFRKRGRPRLPGK